MARTTTRKANTHHCPQCNKDLPRDAFGNDKTRKDGRYRICKACDAINQAKWRARKKAQADTAQTTKAAKAPAKKATTRKRTPAKRTPKATPAS